MRTSVRRSLTVAAVFAIAVGGLLALWVVPGPLSNNWLESVDLSDLADPEARVIQAVTPAAQVVLFSVGGLIALIGLALSFDRHGLALQQAKADREDEATRIGELADQRRMEQERELRARFVTAVELLSSTEKATTRQAGMYALAALADDWAAFGNVRERDVCIEVMCGYLRSAWDPENESTAEDEKRIRATGFNEIAAHLRPGSEVATWDGATFNLRNARVHFDVNADAIIINESDLDFQGATFSGGSVSFVRTTLSGGRVDFRRANFSGGVVFFDQAIFKGGRVSFIGATFSGGFVSFENAAFRGATVSFDRATVSGGSVFFGQTTFSDGRVSFEGATLSGGSAYFRQATFSGGNVGFERAKFSGGRVSFSDATFSGGRVSFDAAAFGGASVSFDAATFSDGMVSFDGATFLPHNLTSDGIKFSGGKVTFEGATYGDVNRNLHRSFSGFGPVDVDTQVGEGHTENTTVEN